MALAGSLEPHCVDDSQNVNKARVVVVALSDELAKIVSAIYETKSLLDKQQEYLKSSIDTCSELESKVEFKITKLVFELVKETKTICLQCKPRVKYTGAERLRYVEANPSCEDPFYIHEGPDNLEVVNGKTTCAVHGPNFKSIKSDATFYEKSEKEIRRNPVIEQELENATCKSHRSSILILL